MAEAPLTQRWAGHNIERIRQNSENCENIVRSPRRAKIKDTSHTRAVAISCESALAVLKVLAAACLLAVYRDILLAYLYVVDYECGNFLTDPCQLDLVGSRVNLFKFRFSLSLKPKLKNLVAQLF